MLSAVASLLAVGVLPAAVLLPQDEGRDSASSVACPPNNSRLLVTFNDKYAHVLANFVAHIHHQDCTPQTSVYCTGSASLALCESLMRPTDAIDCVKYDCVDCGSDDAITQRKAISFLKFFVLQHALHQMDPQQGGWALYLDGTAMVGGSTCYDELARSSADVAVSPEQLSFELGSVCPWPPLVAGVNADGTNANTGLLFFRNTVAARGLLDAFVRDYRSNGGDARHPRPTASALSRVPREYGRYLQQSVGQRYDSCPEQAWFNQWLAAKATRTDSVLRSSAANLQVPTPSGKATVHVLDYRRWPRALVPDVRAYEHWPRAVQGRIRSALTTPLDPSDLPYHREQLSSTGAALPACLYHPHVVGNATAMERGSQADFFAKDGFWYL
jgi:hypothetical protein